MNQVQLIGRMAREPELRRTEKGTPVVSFTLAVDRRFQRDTVDFVDCVAWRGTAEFVNKYFRKGEARRPDRFDPGPEVERQGRQRPEDGRSGR